MTTFNKASAGARTQVTDAPAADISTMDQSITEASAADVRSASEAEAKYRRWISCLSHEVRNPLTLIYSSLQILEKDYPCVKDSPLWEQTKSDVQYLIRLLKDSSAVTREYQPRFTEFSLQEFFQELTVSVQPLLDEHRIQLDNRVARSDADDAVPELFICADRERLKEALTNLLVNAVDALSSLPDSDRRQICLNAGLADSAGHTVFLHVKDNGPGIPDEYLDTLFDPFITHKSNGTGLGLSIVRNIAGLHGGTVSVRTSTAPADSFTDFCLCIPSGSVVPPRSVL